MKLKDRIKNFDAEKFDWVDFAHKVMTPKPIFGKRKPRQPGEVGYGSFSTRMFAMSLDMLIFYVVFSAFFLWISGVMFPQLETEKAVAELTGYLGATATGQISAAKAWDGLVASGIIAKMGFDYTLQTLVIGVLTVFAWMKYATTPGMALFCMYIADAETGGKPTLKQCVLRFLGVILAILPLTLGMVWIVFDKRNQGWQDKLAGTVVLQKESAWPWQKK